MTSAVILHNAPPLAEAIRLEILRVGRRFAVHNEDIDITYNRYGYDTAAWYHRPGHPPRRGRADPQRSLRVAILRGRTVASLTHPVK